MKAEFSNLWSYNTADPDVLQFLILDELHTYDGAQGTDVANLIRRLKLRLGKEKGTLCGVGTSATIGTGRESKELLCNYASEVYGELFDTDNVIDSEEQFKFIVNFANTENGLDSNELSLWLTSGKVNPSDTCVLDLPQTEVDVTLNDVNNSLTEYSSPNITNSLEKYIEYEYANSLGENTKWANRQATLHFIPLTPLPIDARLNVVIGQVRTTYYQNVNGNFVIPLNANIKEYISVTLESDMFAYERTDYVFNVQLVSSKSSSTLSSLNGTVLKEIEISFLKEETIVPSVSIITDKDAYKLNEVATVSIEYENIPEDFVITLTLMLKDDRGNYSSTGWSTTIFKEERMPVSLAGQLTGSYSFTCVVKDPTGMTIISVPCYFIIYTE